MTIRETMGFTHLYARRVGPRTFLLLHGTGGDERDLLPLGEFLDPNAHLLTPRGAGGRKNVARRPGSVDGDGTV
ncbi:MAG: hypothetical protein ACLFPW_04965 [Spirochaetaceae bacterium]